MIRAGLNRRASAIALPLAVIGLAFSLGLASCAKAIDVGLQDDNSGLVEAGPVFTPPPSQSDAGEAGIPSGPQALCAATECPWPWMTCASNDGTLPAYACTTHVSDDVFNCGGCNVECPSPNPNFSLTRACVEGECKYFCSSGAYDCNGITDDGCEVYPESDPLNCGACGNKCADGVACIQGVCGCPPGLTDCGGECVDLTSDDSNCGQCNLACKQQPPPVDAGDVPPNMYYGCKASKCEDLRCYQDRNLTWTDCNDSIRPDGCEINLAAPDPNNCGGCGTKCGPGQKCFYQADTGMACQCQAGKTYCPAVSSWPAPSSPETCADTDNDPGNCGGCGYKCPSVQGATTTCSHGRCGFECPEGRADCNGNAADGCEADLNIDPHHCGACGTSCDNGKGQPCVAGKCATEDCDGGLAR